MFGCLVPITIVVVVIAGIFLIDYYTESWHNISKEKVRISDSEQLREVTGMEFLPDITFSSARAKRTGINQSITFSWSNNLSASQWKQIVKFGKKEGAPLWETNPKSLSPQTFATQKGLAVIDGDSLIYFISYSDVGISVDLWSASKYDIVKKLDLTSFPQYELCYEQMWDMWADYTLEIDVLLKEPYKMLEDELTKCGYGRTEEKSCIQYSKEDWYGNYDSLKGRQTVSIYPKNNIVHIQYESF